MIPASANLPGNSSGKTKLSPWDIASAIVTFLSGLVTIIAFLRDAPIWGLSFLAISTIIGFITLFIFLGRKSILISAIVSVVLSLITFSSGVLTSDYIRANIFAGGSTSIESIPYSLSTGINPNLPRDAMTFKQKTELSNGDLIKSYKLEYTLPENSDDLIVEYSFDFPEEQDLSQYDHIQFTIAFSDIKARSGLFVLDGGSGKYFYLLGDGSIIDAKTGDQEVNISLKRMTSHLSVQSIKSIRFRSSTALNSGNHDFTIKNIRFVR